MRKMEQEHKKAALEAILFAMGDSVELDRLAAAIEETPEETRLLLTQMKEEWEAQDRGVCLVEYEGAFQMCTRGDLYEYLVRVAKTPKKYALTDTLLETLSIIAYKQPVTRLDVEKIRGVNSDHAISRLVEFELDAPGRPLLFGTTEQFLRTFGVKSLEELPRLNEMKLEEFRAEAEEEVREMNSGEAGEPEVDS